jgi:hypothetical protein
MNILSSLLGGNKGQGGQLQVTVVQARQLARKDLLCMYSTYFRSIPVLFTLPCLLFHYNKIYLQRRVTRIAF